MLSPHLQQLLNRKVTRREFLVLGALAAASATGLTGLLRELSSHAGTPTATTEAENGTLQGNAQLVSDGSASDGKAVRFGSPTENSPTPYLPFDLTAAMLARMKTSARKVFPVGVIPYQPFQSYASQEPPGASSPNPDNGGTIRDMYVVDNGSGVTAATARAHEASWYAAAGLDAHVMDYFSSSYTSQMTALMQGALAAGTQIIPQPDCSTSAGNGDANTTASKLIAYMQQYPSAYYKNPATGRYLVMPYRPEYSASVTHNAAYWNTFLSAMSAGGFPCEIIGCFQDSPRSAGNYPFVGAGVWGDPTDTALTSSNSGSSWNSYCQSVNLKSYQWIRVGDDRPRENRAASSNGFSMFMNCWTAAESCDGAYLTTTNDFTEGGQITRTIGNGYGWLDLIAYYNAKYKLGAAAVPIVRDGLYLLHRKQFSSYQGTQTTQPISWRNTPDDKVYALCFLTAPATVTVAGTTFANVPAGVTQVSAPLVTGTIRAQVTRAGQTVVSVTSPHVVANTGVSNKLQYVTSSFPGRAGTSVAF